MNAIIKENYLTSEEEKKLNKYEEEVIKYSNLALENAKMAGEYLDKINSSGLWKKKRKGSEIQFSDFGEYAKAKFGRGKTMSYNYIHISRIINEMEEAGIDYKELGSVQNAMQVYFELKRLGYYNRGQLHPLFREVLAKGLLITENISAISEDGEIKITPESIKAAFETVHEIQTTGAYEIDGQQIPMKFGAIAVDDQASMKLYEDIQRRRLAAGELIEGKKKKRFEPVTFTNNGYKAQNSENKKEVLLECPEHGKVSGVALVKAGIKLSCNCYAINESDEKGSKLIYYKEEQL